MGPAHRTACIMFIVLSLLFFPENVYSFPFQNPSQWVRFSTDEGLPSNRVIDVAEAPNGTVWALTSAGLAFYNGYFWTPAGESLGLHKKQINVFYIDSTGRILALSNGRLFIGNEQGFTFRELLHRNKHLKIHDLVPYNGNKFLILHEDYTLHVWDNRFSQSTPYAPLQKSGTVRRIWNTRSGNIWILTDKAVYSLHDSTLTTRIVTPSFLLNVSTLSEDKLSGGIMSVMHPAELRGLWAWKPNEEPHLTNEGRIDFIQSLDVMDNAHPMYAYMLGEVRAQTNNTWSTLEPLPEQLINILFLKYRKNGGLWVGTESGLFLYKVTTTLWKYWKKPQTSRSNKVTDFLSATDGS
ncbi:MAG: hypothetical protein HYZ33_00785, partial [Ignavibacteriales bacterium]|nr:hypothetical protein [Ignavibacteriales bacterium]